MDPNAASQGQLALQIVAARQRRWWAGLALTAVLALSIFGWYVVQLRASTERQAQVSTEAAALALEGHVSHTVAASANTLDVLADNDLVTAPAPDPVGLSRLLAHQLRGQPALRSVSVLDAQGAVLASSHAPDVGQRIALAALQPATMADGVGRTGPLLLVRHLDELAPGTAPAAAKTALPLVRSVRAANGSTRWLVLLLNLDHFTSQHGLAMADQPIRALVLGLDGTVLSATGQDALPAGGRLLNWPVTAALQANRDHGFYIGGGSDGRRAAAAYRASPRWPLVALAEMPFAVVEAARELQLRVAAALTATLMLLLVGLGWTTGRSTRLETLALQRWDRLSQALARSEEQRTLALEGGGHGVWDVDVDTGSGEVPASFQALLGYPPRAEVWSLDQWRKLVHPDDQAPTLAAVQDHLQGRTASLWVELRMRCADGSWKWLLARGSRSGQTDAAGRQTRLVGTATDISARKAAEAALRESDARRQAILHSSLDAIVTVTAEGVVVDFNPAAERMFGHSAGQALGRPMQDLIIPQHHRRAHQAGMARYQHTGIPHVLNRRIETEAMRADGTVFPVELTITPVSTDGGEFFTATLRDISDRLRVEAALRDSQALLAKAGSIGAIGGWQLDVDTGIVTSTDESCRIHDIPPGSKGTLAQTLAFYAPQAQPVIRAAVDKAIATGQGFDLQLPFISAKGRRVYVRAVATAEQEDGRVVRLSGALQDITDRHQAEVDLLHARQRELVIGARIQQALFVDAPDQRLPGMWLSTLNQASQGIDGDFVEMISLGERGVDIIVGDVMGKGVTAALMAAGTKMQFSRCMASLLADIERPGDLPSPAQVVAAVHHAMTANLQALEAFVTLSYLRLDMQAGTLTWVGCGHEEPLLFRGDGVMVTLPNQHPPLGVLATDDFQQDVLPFVEGDALFLSSDGAADALMPDGSRLGRARVIAMLTALMSRLDTPAAVLHTLRRELTATGARITDDLTLALAMATGPTPLASRRELPAVLKSVRHVRGLVEHRCRQVGVDEVQTSLFAVACVEAFTNAVRHTRGRPADAPVELVVKILPDALVVDIVTIGENFVVPAQAPTTDLADFPEGGFGLSIMRQVSDAVEYRHDMGVNTVRLVQRLGVKPA
jgi:PAS domain S-box-containing protein